MDSSVDWCTGDDGLATGANVRSLACLSKGARGVVSSVGLPGAARTALGDLAGATLVRRLMELGFVPGEALEVIEEIRPGGDPIAVRVGSSMFALRRREAEAVRVRLEPAAGP
jgi:ferrous iron transport protein A